MSKKQNDNTIKNIFYKLSETELREISRTSIASMEMWAKRFVHEKMTNEYGADYLSNAKSKIDGRCLINNDVIGKARKRIKKNPQRYPRLVDALLFSELCAILYSPELYEDVFKDVLEKYIYPQGRDEAERFLKKLSSIRDPLSHTNPFSVHEAEQAVCYSDDFIEGLRKYYSETDMKNNKWNVPRIIGASDSVGTPFCNFEEYMDSCIYEIEHDFYYGDIYTVNVEIDPSFSSDEYDIKWHGPNHHSQDGGTKYTVKFVEEDMGKFEFISCSIICKKNHHEYYNEYDYKLSLKIHVLEMK